MKNFIPVDMRRHLYNIIRTYHVVL